MIQFLVYFMRSDNVQPLWLGTFTEKNGFVTATKLGTTNKFFVAATKNFAAATKRFGDRTKHFVVVTKYFCYPYFTNDFVGGTKPFIQCCPIAVASLGCRLISPLALFGSVYCCRGHEAVSVFFYNIPFWFKNRLRDNSQFRGKSLTKVRRFKNMPNFVTPSCRVQGPFDK